MSVIIPTWNNLAMLRLCLDSIARHSSLAIQVVVHVNDGSDGTLAWVRKNGIEHTRTAHNVGICRAVNLAAAKSRGVYLTYLNDDQFVLPQWDTSLYERLESCGMREPCYVSGSMIQAVPISPCAIEADYGQDLETFEERRLLEDYHNGRLVCRDWSGATWPPSAIHRKWFTLAGGYSEDLFPGFYSDLDFSMKLWQIGCRRFWGTGSSLVYHFGEKTTSLVRGERKSNVKRSRKWFLKKWGMLPSTFRSRYLRAGEEWQEVLPEPTLSSGTFLWERVRTKVISAVA